jgi:type IV secretory pathway TraG/TraD family ATPase VirD4
MAGAPGSGKSLAFRQLLDSARARGHRALVADLGGEFVKHYYRPGKDLILNPFDRRTEHWSPFAEMRQAYDAARIAASMIPEGSGESREWNGYARAILEGILERCWETDQATNQALVYYALGANTKELAELCAGTPAAVYFVEGNERQLGSIRGILASYMKPLTYLRPEAGAQAFSIRSWIENEGDGWLFITFKKDQLDALQKMLAAQVDTAASAILSTDSQLDRRLWVSLDEFAQLGEIRQLEPLLAMGRKYGVCAVLGMQGMSQPAMTYGRERAQAVLASLGTWTVFRQADAESAEYMSRFLGDEELRREVSSTSTNKDSTSSSTSEQIVRQRAVMPGELQQLPARRAIVNIAGPLPPATTTIQIPADKPQAQHIKAVEEAPDARAMQIQHPKGQQPALDAPAAPPQLQGPARFEV